jgi:hypothetical protein
MRIKPTSAKHQAVESERATLDDLRRHRVMKGYPPHGQIFVLRSGPETRERLAKLKRNGQILTNMLARTTPPQT